MGHDQEGWWGPLGGSPPRFCIGWDGSRSPGKRAQLPTPSTQGKEKLERPSTSDPKTNLFTFCQSESSQGQGYLPQEQLSWVNGGTYSQSEILSEETRPNPWKKALLTLTAATPIIVQSSHTSKQHCKVNISLPIWWNGTIRLREIKELPHCSKCWSQDVNPKLLDSKVWDLDFGFSHCFRMLYRARPGAHHRKPMGQLHWFSGIL